MSKYWTAHQKNAQEMAQMVLTLEEEDALRRFVLASNEIEGIIGQSAHQLNRDINAHRKVLAIKRLETQHLNAFVRTVASANIRDKNGMNVVVGNHRPPPGGWKIEPWLRKILSLKPGVEGMPDDMVKFAHLRHCEFESLHPYMDGNGRAGRALWLRDMGGPGAVMRYGFLQQFYYSSLDSYRNGQEWRWEDPEK